VALDSAAWIANLTELKAHLGITDAAQDTFLENLTNRAYKILETYLGRVIKSATYTEYMDGDGTGELILNQFPIISVTSIHDDLDRDFTSTFLIAATDYVIYKERGVIKLFRNEGAFQKGLQNLKVIYVAGYATVPGDLVDALIQMVEFMYNRSRTGGMQSQSLGGKSETYDQSRIPAEVKRTLNSYRVYCKSGASTT
jgi:uncharacterized phiE125 gp8 family phage protein